MHEIRVEKVGRCNAAAPRSFTDSPDGAQMYWSRKVAHLHCYVLCRPSALWTTFPNVTGFLKGEPTSLSSPTRLRLLKYICIYRYPGDRRFVSVVKK